MTAPSPLLLLALALAACEVRAPTPEPPVRPPAADSAAADTAARRPATAVEAAIQPVGRGGARGTVDLTAVEGGVRVRARLEGLSEEDFHALQVLSGRACDADPAVHLGAEAGTPHGGPYAPPGFRHAGDLGNVRGDEGEGRYDRIDPVLALDGPRSAVGRAVVVRAGRDDAASPDGAAGDVIGCGTLEAAP